MRLLPRTISSVGVALATLPLALGALATPGLTPQAIAAQGQTALASPQPLPTAQINGVVWDQTIVGNVVYVVGEGGYYLRQKVRLGSRTGEMPRSLRVDDYPYLQEMLREKKIFVNRDLIKGLPDLAAPISYEGRVIAVLQIYHLDFEQWSLYEKNLLSITARLVSSSLGRAYAWEQETAGRKYIDETRILRIEEFQKVIEEFRERRRMQADYPVALLPVSIKDESYREIDHKIANSIRAEDFIGATADGVALLLPDVAGKTLDMVRERLEKAGIETGESLSL